jgi:CheY-like chemotaxis protein
VARILLVEDNEPNLELMTYLLVASGHLVVPATAGERAVELAREEPPDLVVLDIQLPDMSGYEVLSLLHAEPAMAGVRIVAVTANAMVGDRDQALAAGFDGYLPKPIEPASFATAIGSHLPPHLQGHEPRPQWSDRG